MIGYWLSQNSDAGTAVDWWTNNFVHRSRKSAARLRTLTPDHHINYRIHGICQIAKLLHTSSDCAARDARLIHLLQELKRLNLVPGDYAVFGSGPLIVRGIIAATNDLDVICRGRAWEQVKTLGEGRYDRQYDVEMVELLDGQLTFGTKWGIGDFDVNELIEEAELIEGVPFVRLEHVIAYKRQRSSDKDMQHLHKLEQARRQIKW